MQKNYNPCMLLLLFDYVVEGLSYYSKKKSNCRLYVNDGILYVNAHLWGMS